MIRIMSSDSHTLSVNQLECPEDCPFLGVRVFLPDTLPFYCNQYETFLGVTPARHIRRCSHCCGVCENIVETGLSFIDSYTIDHYRIEETKRAFLGLDLGFQKLFVNVVSQTGAQIALDPGDEDNPDAFSDKILKSRQELKNKFGSPEAQDFKGLLDGEGMPLMSRQTKTLLMNLFLVLDNSEKDMLKHILQNANQVEAFLSHFQKQPQDSDLLANTRALIYDYDQKIQLELDRQRAKNVVRKRRNITEQQRQQVSLSYQRRLNQEMQKEMLERRSYQREHHR